MWPLAGGLNPYFIGLPILIFKAYWRFVMNLSSSLNPYFIGLPILITKTLSRVLTELGLNPYFIGLPILIAEGLLLWVRWRESQSLFYWITYSYKEIFDIDLTEEEDVSILILLDYLFLLLAIEEGKTVTWMCLNPYFIGLPILIRWISLS